VSPEMADVLSLAREWRTAASDDLWFSDRNRLANRFLKLWIALNAAYAAYADQLDGDRAQLRHFAQWEPVISAHRRNLGDRVYDRAVQSLATPGVYNYRNDSWVTIKTPDSAVEVLDAIYQVRCNLFHGRKRPTNLRDAQLIKASDTVLSRILDSVLSNDDAWAQVAAA
jgi:hypothetical protein